MKDQRVTDVVVPLLLSSAVLVACLALRKRRKSNTQIGGATRSAPAHTSRMRLPSGKRSVSDLVRDNIRKLTPYRCARDDYSEGILMDANESPFGAPVSEGQGTLDINRLPLNRYPDPKQEEVKALVAEFRGVRPEQIFVGVGSDEAIDLLMRIFGTPGEDSILLTPPTYGMYKVCAKVNDLKVQIAPLTPDFEIDVPEILRTATPSTKLLFLCSPGNPTGKSIPLSVVRDIIKGGYDGMVVIDEAYIDFSSGESAVSLIDELDRVVVLQTLSKAFGMAAIRMGFALSNEQVVQYMNNVKAPYSINRLTQEVAVRALRDRTVFNQRISTILAERKRLQEALRGLSCVKKVKETDANFFLVEVENAKEIYKRMADNGVVVRFRGNELHCKDCLRISVGTPEENSKLLEILPITATSVAAAKQVQ